MDYWESRRNNNASRQKTIVVINDNDFEIAINAIDEDGNEVDITEYTYDTNTKEMSIEDNKSDINIELVKNKEESEVWTIELKEEISAFSNKVSEVEETIVDSSQSKDNAIVYIGVIGAIIVWALVYIFNKKKK